MTRRRLTPLLCGILLGGILSVVSGGVALAVIPYQATWVGQDASGNSIYTTASAGEIPYHSLDQVSAVNLPAPGGGLLYSLWVGGPNVNDLPGAVQTDVGISNLCAAYPYLCSGSGVRSSGGGDEGLYYRPTIYFNGRWQTPSQWMYNTSQNGLGSAVSTSWEFCRPNCDFVSFAFTGSIPGGGPILTDLGLFNEALLANNEYDGFSLPGPGQGWLFSEYWWYPFSGQDTVGGTKEWLYVGEYACPFTIPNYATANYQISCGARAREAWASDRTPPNPPNGTAPVQSLPIRAEAITKAQSNGAVAFGFVIELADGTIVHDEGRITCRAYVLYPIKPLRRYLSIGKAVFLNHEIEACAFYIPRKLSGLPTAHHRLVTWLRLRTQQGSAFAVWRAQVA